MTWFLVDVKLEILIVYQETTTLLENREVSVVFLRQHVQIVTLGQLSFHFNRLTMNVRTTSGVNVAGSVKSNLNHPQSI
jgi:hypothetical protein